MKNIKRIIMILCFMVIGGSIEAQPPTPSTVPTSQNRQQLSINRVQGPIGTATALLLSLAGGCVAYKLRKNTKKEQK